MTLDFPILTTLILVPAIGSVVVAALPKGLAGRTKEIALGISLVTLVLGGMAAAGFDRTSTEQFQFVEQHEWIPQFGVSYALGVDGIALTLVLLAVFLSSVCILAAWRDVPEGGGREKYYFSLMLALEAVMVGVFTATDVFLFYVFFEASLVPIYFLIGSFGGAQRQYAAVKFLLYNLLGGLVMLVAVIALYYFGPGGTDGFLVAQLTGLDIDPTAERLMWVGFFFAFAIKAPLWPVHTWLPDASTEARPATAVLLVGVLDKIGTYGMIRFCLQLFPGASEWATPVVVTLAVISIIYGALLAIGQSDIMRLIAYTSVSHFGFMILGIFALTTTGWAGSSLYMVNHGLSTAALFLFAGMFIRRRGSKRIADYGGWQRITPALAGIWLVAGLSTLSLPGLSPFISEFLVFMGTYQTWPVAAVFSLIAIVLAAIYILFMYKRMTHGPVALEVDGGPEGSDPRVVSGVTGSPVFVDENGGPVVHDHHGKPRNAAGPVAHATSRIRDLTSREKLVAAPILAALLVLGFLPNLALGYINPAVDTTLSHVGVTDPAATIANPGSAK